MHTSDTLYLKFLEQASKDTIQGIIMTLVDLAVEHDVPLQFDRRTYEALSEFVSGLDPLSNNIIACFEERIDECKELLELFTKIQRGQMGGLGVRKTSDTLERMSTLSDLDMAIMQSLTSPDIMLKKAVAKYRAEVKRLLQEGTDEDASTHDIDAILMSVFGLDGYWVAFTSEENRQHCIMANALDGNGDEFERYLDEKGVASAKLVYGSDPLSEWLTAVTKMLTSDNTEDLRDLLHEAGYSLHRLPSKKPGTVDVTGNLDDD